MSALSLVDASLAACLLRPSRSAADAPYTSRTCSSSAVR
jgi:hypothetical protein